MSPLFDGYRRATLHSTLRLGRLLTGVLDQGGQTVFVGVIHRIHDPDGFRTAEQKAIEQGLPPNVALPVHAATNDHRLGICIWEGESVEAVRDLVEQVVGPYSENEYLALTEVDGLTPQLATSA